MATRQQSPVLPQRKTERSTLHQTGEHVKGQLLMQRLRKLSTELPRRLAGSANLSFKVLVILRKDIDKEKRNVKNTNF